MRFRSLPIATSCAMMYDHPFISQNQHPLLGENVRFFAALQEFWRKSAKMYGSRKFLLAFFRVSVYNTSAGKINSMQRY